MQTTSTFSNNSTTSNNISTFGEFSDWEVSEDAPSLQDWLDARIVELAAESKLTNPNAKPSVKRPRVWDY